METTLSVGGGSHLEKVSEYLLFFSLRTELMIIDVLELKQEDADALIGRILLCAAIIRSEKLGVALDSDIAKCIQILINASHHKSYHSSLAYTFLLELLEKLSDKQFQSIMWPQMQKELKRSWDIQNINTVHFLIRCQLKYPKLIDDEFLSNSIQTNEILTPLAYKHLSRLFWSPSTIMIAATHPSYETLGTYLSSIVSEKKFLDFWRNEIDAILVAPTKFKETVTLRLLTILFNDGKIRPQVALKLLSSPFIKMITKSIQTYRQQKQSDYNNALYLEFFDSVEKYLKNRVGIEESEKVSIIQRFIDFPGMLTIEKFLPNRTIHKFIYQLKAEGVQLMFDFYKSILMDQTKKNPKSEQERWVHADKEHCVQMLQSLLMHRSIQNEQEWRTKELIFMMKHGFFYANIQNNSIVFMENSAEVLPSDIAYKMKQTFFAALQVKSQSLEIERMSLLAIVEFCNNELTTKSPSKKLRHQLTDEALQAWNKMYKNVTAQKRAKKVQKNVFDVLMIHLGLHLFVDTKLAIFSINDLEKCMERALSKMKAKSNLKTLPEDSGEAEWIEVVVDLFLQLLSQNKGFLRNIVDNVFPELCNHLNAAAVDQILLMLDMNEKNPLTTDADEEVEDDLDSDNDGSNELGEDESNDSEESDEESSDDDVTDDDEGTMNDQLRCHVSQALGGAALDTDIESIDLNNMSDDEASRLDMALGEAFKSISKTTGGGKKKTKLERSTNTTVMHFRIRVLDLIEIYLKTKPTLAITLNILADLIPMYENCAGNKDLEPLTRRLQHVLKTLHNLKEFSSIEDVSEAKLYELFESIIDIKTKPSAINEQNKLKLKIVGFLIAVSQLLKSSDQILLEAIAGCLEQFLKSRNPRVSIGSLIGILRSRWNGVWKLGQITANTTLLHAKDFRPFRRVQAIELLTVIYNNHGFISSKIEEFNEYNQKIETAIQSYINWLAVDGQTSSKEFTALIQLLQEIHKRSQTISDYKCHLIWGKTCEIVQTIRRKTIVDSYQVYLSFCKRFELTKIENSEVQLTAKSNGPKVLNGHHNNDIDGDNVEATQTNGLPRKRKSNSDLIQNNELSEKRRALLEKKRRKQNRLKLSSVGLNDHTFEFTSDTEEVEMK